MAFAKIFDFVKLLAGNPEEGSPPGIEAVTANFAWANSMLVYFCVRTGTATIKSIYRLPYCFKRAQISSKKQLADMKDYLCNIFFWAKISAKDPYAKGQTCSQHGSPQADILFVALQPLSGPCVPFLPLE